MAGRSSIRWSIKEIAELLRKRQLNKFDANIGVYGSRDDGKRTFLYQIFNSLKTKRLFKSRENRVFDKIAKY